MATITHPSDSPARDRALSDLLARAYVINWELVAWGLIFVLALFTRFFMLGERVMSHDESLHTVFSNNLYEDGNYRHDPMMHGPILFHMTALSYFLFGVNDFTARIYPAVLGVLLVLFPILFRRWLGKSGAVVASIMLLVSPLLTYYSRYIRHDIPSIMAGMVMFWAAMMYLSGPANQRRRAHWLYILSAAMLWNLGSKETAYIYIAIFGSFLTLYWLARVFQRVFNVEARMMFVTVVIGFLLAGVAALMMITINSVALAEFPTLGARLNYIGDNIGTIVGAGMVPVALSTFLSWTGLVMMSVVALVIGPAIWAYRRVHHRFDVPDALMLLAGFLAFVLIAFVLAPDQVEMVNGDAVETSLAAVWLAVGAIVTMALWLIYAAFRIDFRRNFGRTAVVLLAMILVVSTLFLVVERVVTEKASTEDTSLQQPVPGEESATVSSEISSLPLIGLYVGAAVIIALLAYAYNRGWWRQLEPFPEFDVLIVMGTLILPWLTAVFIRLTAGTEADYAAIADSLGSVRGIVPRDNPAEIGKIVIGFLAFVPMMTVSIVAGLMWNWRRWIICSLIFHTLFAFFFTTVFTNIEGLASGMVYSLEYWFEQQGVQRGSQPQYYYTLLITPFYEFLPIIGSVLAMIAGMSLFWKKHRDYQDHRIVESALAESISEWDEPVDEASVVAQRSGTGDVLLADADDVPVVETETASNVTENVPPEWLGWLLMLTTAASFLALILLLTVSDANPLMHFVALLVLIGNIFGLSNWYYQRYIRGGITRPQSLDGFGARLDAIDAHGLPESEEDSAVSQNWQLDRVPFTLFVGWWAVLNLLAYTLAGEKMPWLGTHLTVPLILLSGWYFGRIFERISWREFQARGWIYLFLLPLVFIGLFQVVTPFFSGQAPFQGTTSVQQQWTYRWIAVLIVSAGGLYGLFWLVQQTGWRTLRHMVALVGFVMLAVITFRSSWIASFINYDEASEFLVYAHAAPGNEFVIDKVRDLSLRTTDSMNIRVLHDDRFSWPGSWYLRDFTNTLYFGSSTPSAQEVENAAVIIVGDSNRSKIEPLVEGTFQRFDHLRMWWPMQDYFGLSAERINNLLDTDSPQAGDTRRGLFDIWWSRDYSTYALATSNPSVAGRDADRFNIDKGRWPVSDSMSLYVRKDIVAQVWPYGVGDGDPSGPFTTVTENTCAINFEPRAASLVFEQAGALRQPLGIAIGDDGVLYVAESEDGASRISMFDLDGTYLGSFGQPGAAQTDGAYFTRPHSVAAGPNGNVVVADTWNYRIRVFDEETKDMLAVWGQPLTAGEAAGREPLDGFWGPRDVAVDATGDIYVSDTGNKRVRVYDRDGNYIRDIGSAGTGDGQLNEPAGLAISGNRLYVADTWNRRIAIFNLDGIFVKNVPVRGWYEEQGNRPYLAVDETRGLLYVTDPDAGRIMVHDLEGECLGSFGQPTDVQPDATQFRIVGGLAVDEAGNLYASDLVAGRIVRFDPYEVPETVESEVDGESAEASEEAFPRG